MRYPIRFSSTSLFTALITTMSSSLRAQAAAPGLATMRASVDSIVQAELLDRGTVSASMVIMRNGQILIDRTWGYADVASQKPADTATAYRLGSMSKNITAALLLKL